MSRWYSWICGFFLLSTMQFFGVIDRLVYGHWDGKGGDKITTTLNLLLILVSLVIFGNSCRQNRKGYTFGSVLAFSAVGFLFLSALWSLSPVTTTRVAFVYLFVIFGVIGLARTVEADAFMQLLSGCCFLSAIASLALRVVSPGNAFMDGVDFIGIFPHKNFLGQVMATGALATLHGIRVARRGYLGKLCMLFVFVAMAFESKSTAALLASMVFCGISGFDALWRRGGAARMVGVVLAVFLVPAFLAAIIEPDMILELIGKDPTLTGRTEIWAYVIKDIWMKPLLGWGYFGFWEQNNPAAREISDAVLWVVPEAHNGLLEFLLNIGVLGTALFVFLLLRIVVLAFRCLRTPARALAISTITCCVGILLEGVSEAVLLAPTQSLTPILFITGLMCERAVWVARRRPHRLPILSGAPSFGAQERSRASGQRMMAGSGVDGLG
jgi:exopolysaccharide production protein ExoQ